MSEEKGGGLTVIEGGKGGKKPHKRGGGEKAMSQRQIGFARAILEGCTNVVAYERNYSTSGMTRKSMTEAGCRLRKHPKIKAMIDKAQALTDNENLRTGAFLRGHLENTLFELSQDDDNSTKLKACHQLAQSEKVGFYLQRIETSELNDMSEDELIDELKSTIKQAFAS